MLPSQLPVLLTLLVCTDTVPVYSSFWAPLLDRGLLHYRVDAAFEPEAARSGREHYATEHGYRGERLIADLGSGRAPGAHTKHVKMYGEVKFYYT